jgi:hypothetical protein
MDSNEARLILPLPYGGIACVVWVGEGDLAIR